MQRIRIAAPELGHGVRIVFLTRSLEYGGAERQLSALASGLGRRGNAVTVVSLYDQVPLAAGMVQAGVDVEIVGKKGRWDVVGFATRLVRLMRRLKPDVIHSYMPGANLICAVLKPLLPAVPLVWGVRSSDVDLRKFEWLTRLIYRAEPFLSRLPELIIINSQAGLEYAAAHGYRAERMVVVPNGFDVENFRPDPEGRRAVRAEWGVSDDVRLIGMVARLDPFKDHPTFLRAAAKIADVRNDVTFVCVGDDPADMSQSIARVAADLGIDKNVRFLPARRDIREVYSALDVLCSSSYTEGFPNVLAEAMACGTPCVATDAGDSRAIVGNAGVIVPRRDPEALAAGVLHMLERPIAAAVVRDRIVRQFSLEALVNRTEDLLRTSVAS